jgi:tetratricopeptide (TPR) repeat protein
VVPKKLKICEFGSMLNLNQSASLILAILLSAAAASAQTGICDQAATQFRDHRWPDAAEAYANCDKAAPGQTDALLYRGKALVNQQKFPEAAASLESYLATHPQSDDALYLLGYVRFRQDQPKESLALFTQAAKRKAPAADDLKIVALDYVLLNDYTSAARYLEQSLQMNPDDVEARYHLGRVRYQQNQFDPAIAAFEEVLRRNPSDVKAEDNLGLCLEAKGRGDAALAAYRKAIAMESASSLQSEQPYLNLGKLLTTMNRAAEAVPVLTQAAIIAPDSATVHYELGRAQCSLERFEPARAQLEKAVALDPKNSSPHYLLGRIYQRLGKREQATQQFKLTEELIRQQNAKSGGMASSH